MSDNGNPSTAIRRFVRESLGCSCPDAVFDDIRVTADSDLFAVAHTVYEIGGRLLVAAIVPADWQAIETSLGQFVDAGKRYRDRHGFNRFRLVIAADDEAAARRLSLLFESLPNTDDKTHLHVIGSGVLPDHGRL